MSSRVRSRYFSTNLRNDRYLSSLTAVTRAGGGLAQSFFHFNSTPAPRLGRSLFSLKHITSQLPRPSLSFLHYIPLYKTINHPLELSFSPFAPHFPLLYILSLIVENALISSFFALSI